MTQVGKSPRTLNWRPFHLIPTLSIIQSSEWTGNSCKYLFHFSSELNRFTCLQNCFHCILRHLWHRWLVWNTNCLKEPLWWWSGLLLLLQCLSHWLRLRRWPQNVSLTPNSVFALVKVGHLRRTITTRINKKLNIVGRLFFAARRFLPWIVFFTSGVLLFCWCGVGERPTLKKGCLSWMEKGCDGKRKLFFRK